MENQFFFSFPDIFQCISDTIDREFFDSLQFEYAMKKYQIWISVLLQWYHIPHFTIHVVVYGKYTITYGDKSYCNKTM